MSDSSVNAVSEFYTPGPVQYSPAKVSGVAVLVVAGILSLVAVIPALYGHTHPALLCIPPGGQRPTGVGTIMNARWIHDRNVVSGGIKQAGNVGMALWSFALSAHVFMLLFVRRLSLSAMQSWVILGVGWFLIAFVVVIGPTVIERSGRGPYFGPTGFWCWITGEYPREQFFLEYFFEFLSAFLSFFMYMIVLLRVRGNLTRDSQGKWHLRFVPHGERWRLAIRRDSVDECMMNVAARMIWYPSCGPGQVAYTILLVPVTVARFWEFGGHHVPFRATIFADFVFNLQGVANVLLLLITHRFVPHAEALPIFAPRRNVSMGSPESFGITPFMLPPRDEIFLVGRVFGSKNPYCRAFRIRNMSALIRKHQERLDRSQLNLES
ncbi:uncharacterized protein BXZ73DRAFT_75195 [Epithele typhae]|uniref:uncharacterized protein n=1 Tax=Epithele typhae TaxID=378194 RepID=UPI0020086CA9|nr:uncharacterized protein BXZ73DRAFT_75195 [Epithele typhae]KAH9941236.1 hypothetical protein BXZ73DRAFT_75195 [Epithele typhae]